MSVEGQQRRGRVAAYPAHEPAGPPLAGGGFGIEFILDFARRRFWGIVFSVIFMCGVGFTVFMAMPAPFMATATLQIDTRKFQLFQQPASLGDQSISSSPELESQLEVLKSEPLARKVIDDLHLADDPDFGMAPGIPILSRLIEARRTASESWRTQKALQIFDKRYTVRRRGMSYLIDINFESSNPERAAQIANAIAQAYITSQIESEYQVTREGSKWLEGRLQELKDQVAAAEKAVIDYKSKNKIVDAGNGRLLTEQQLADLNSQLSIARAKTSEMRARLDRINSALNDAADTTLINVTASDGIANQVITKLRGQYLELAAREAEWSEKYGRNHLAVVNLRNNMRGIRTSILDELQRLRESYKGDYEAASEAQQLIEKQLQDAISQSHTSNEAQVILRNLETSSATYKTLYDNFLKRYSEAVEQQSFPYTAARLITKAIPPINRSHRKRLLVLAMTPFMGLFLGIALGALRDFLDRGFRTSNQVETVLDLPCLALIPLQKGPKDRDGASITDPTAPLTPNETGFSRRTPSTPDTGARLIRSGANITDPTASSSPNEAVPVRRAISTTDTGARLIATEPGIASNVVEQPFSRFAEAIRTIKLAADLNGADAANKVIGITSAVPNEGKSTIAAALAHSIAQFGGRTILVDCDLRNPSLSRDLAPNASAGIVEVLYGKVALEDALWKEPSLNMAFLPVLSRLRVAHSSEILNSAGMKRLFEKLRYSYDYVIVDLPPLAPLVDVRATTHLVDSYLLVVEWGRTYTAIVQHALTRASRVYEKVFGVVLNKVDMKALSLYDGNRARYYHNKAYARYGYTD